MFYSDDPVMDEMRHTRAMDLKQARRPKCCNCGHHIMDEEAVHLVLKKDEIWICNECIEDNGELIDE